MLHLMFIEHNKEYASKYNSQILITLYCEPTCDMHQTPTCTYINVFFFATAARAAV